MSLSSGYSSINTSHLEYHIALPCILRILPAVLTQEQQKKVAITKPWLLHQVTEMSIAQGCFDVIKGLKKCQGAGVYFLLCLLSYQRALVIQMPSAALKHNTHPGKIKISHTGRLFVQIKRSPLI